MAWIGRLGATLLHTGLGWADSDRPGWKTWFDRQMEAFEEFETTVTFCFTPEHQGPAPHHTSLPKDPMYFVHFCARMIGRSAPAQQRKAVA